MPITLNPDGGGGALGWGMSIFPHTTFVGPLPSGSFWLISFFSDADRTKGVFQVFRPWTSNDPGIQLTVHQSSITLQTSSVADGDTIYWDAQLWQSGTTNVDESNGSLVWKSTSGFYQAILQSLPVAGTGLSTAQAAQLTDIQTKVTSSEETTSGTVAASIGALLGVRSIDTLSTVELTSGPTTGFTAHDLPVWVQAIIIRITEVAPIDQPLAADDGWYPRALAVVNIFHGSDLYQRVAVHTVSRVIQVGPSDLHSFALQALETAVWPDSVTLQVTFAAGVSGQVLETILP